MAEKSGHPPCWWSLTTGQQKVFLANFHNHGYPCYVNPLINIQRAVQTLFALSGTPSWKWFQNLRLGPRARREPIRRRLKSYGGTGEKAQSRLRRDERTF
jgi:hypothetical protein